MNAKFRVDITPSAEADIRDIWNDIAQDNPAQADAFIQTITQQISTLETFPWRCPLIPENDMLGGSDYRHALYGSYRTIFRIDENHVIILRVLHGARLLKLGYP